VTPVEQLVDEAAAKAGPWPGDVPFLANLELLAGSCRGLNGIGQEVLHRAAVRHLRNLRYLQAYVDDHPDVARRPVAGAVVVTGLPRTGTTLLHNLLALDPGHRVLRFWEALHPLPPDAGGPRPEALQAQAERWLEAFRRLVPAFQTIHRATATGPEECDALLQNAFASQHFDDMFDAPAYSSWLAGAGLIDEYALYASFLRVLSGPDTAWALKSPSHLGHLDALLAALPGATVVLLHRHPHVAVASYASLIRTLRLAYCDDVSSEEIGRQALERTATAMRRALDVRAGPLGAAVVDVSYDDLVRDPVAAVRTVYAACGRSLDAGVDAAVRAWVVAHPPQRHGPHRYDLAEFGLTGDQVDAAFGDYMERFRS
jgi:hypothetical protein